VKRVRLVSVRLSEIPLDERMAAARVECLLAETDDERAAIFLAAMFPSDRVYYVPAAA